MFNNYTNILNYPRFSHHSENIRIKRPTRSVRSSAIDHGLPLNQTPHNQQADFLTCIPKEPIKTLFTHICKFQTPNHTNLLPKSTQKTPTILQQKQNTTCNKKRNKVKRLVFKHKASCELCGREITREDYDNYQGLCWECWDSRLTEEVEGIFDKAM